MILALLLSGYFIVGSGIIKPLLLKQTMTKNNQKPLQTTTNHQERTKNHHKPSQTTSKPPQTATDHQQMTTVKVKPNKIFPNSNYLVFI